MIDAPTPSALEVLTDAREMLAERYGKAALKDLLTGKVCALGAIIIARFPEKDKDNALSIAYTDTEDNNGAAEAVDALYDAIDSSDSWVKQEFEFDATRGHRITADDKRRAIYRYNDDFNKAAVLALFDKAIAALALKGESA